ncbi:nuclease-related domain-containing protein [Cytobacillus sp. FJAT-54145]|uniref:Nuclease-related domain-containing protein n=1 Tax=Cytobacillus spartinae TaxID=3299023 RepID=A0ABW6KCQ9_9BACI
MMVYKPRTKSSELLMLSSLNTRMKLTETDKQHYLNLRRGYDGEKLFDSLIENLRSDCLIVNDLLLKLNNTLFQIDSLIIFQETIFVFEVKNFEGDFYYSSDRIYTYSKKQEISNPLNQLNRTDSLLRQLLQQIGYNATIQSSVIFINPEFTLYQAPLDKPFIFPTQVNKFIHKLNKISSSLNETHKNLVEKLLSLHIKESPYTLLPSYNYDLMEKGITCVCCSSFSVSIKGKKVICEDCNHGELITDAVLRNINEFKLLFPDIKITTTIIHDWCKIIKTKKRIQRILEKNFKMVGVHQWAYYE